MNITQYIDPNTLLLLGFCALVLHLVCFFVGKKIQILFLLVGLLCLATNISTSSRFEYVMFVKYVRIYLNLAVIVLGFFLYKKHPPGSATTFLLLAAGIYWISGFWSLEDPQYYLMYNSFFFMSVLCGIFLANSVNSLEQFNAGVRVFAVIGTAAGAFYLTMYFVNPSLVVVQGRLASLGGIATTFSADCAYFALAPLYLLFCDTKKTLKPLWSVGAALLIMCILLSGSRTGLIFIAISVVSLVVMKRRSPITVVAVVAALAVTITGITLFLDDMGIVQRFISGSNTRREVWAETLSYVSYSPWYGFGSSMVYGRDGMVGLNPHNCYIQFLIQCGLLGLTFLVFAWGLLFLKMRRLIKVSRKNPQQAPIVIFLIAMSGVLFLHMMPDHSIVAATSGGTAWMGFVFAMCDRMTRKPIKQPAQRRAILRVRNQPAH